MGEAVTNEVVEVQPGDTVVVVDGPDAQAPDQTVYKGPTEAGEVLAQGTWFDFFRAGMWNGEELGMEFMTELMTTFNPAMRKCKYFIGHNSCFEPEKPTLGFAAAQRVDSEGFMQSLPAWLHDSLKEAVNSGMYPDRSLEAYHFPEEGGWTLTGIAFLGASPPAVSALRDFKFESAQHKGRQRMQLTIPGSALKEMRTDAGRLTFSAGIYRYEKQKIVVPGRKAEAAAGQILNTNTKGGEVEMTKEEMEKLAADAASKALEAFKGGDEYKSLQEKAAKADDLEKNLAAERKEKADRALAAKHESIKQFIAKLLEAKKVTPHVVEDLGLEAALMSMDDEQHVKCAGKDVTALDRAKQIVASLCDASMLFKQSDSAADADAGKPEGSTDKTLEAAKDVRKPVEFSMADHARKQQDNAA